MADEPNQASDGGEPIPSVDSHAPQWTVVGLGASAGGLAALRSFFQKLPREPGLPFVVVMHLSPDYESHLPQVLQPYTSMPVEQVAATVELEPNHIYVIPPNANLESVDTHLRLSELEDRPRRRTPIDHFFRTMTETHDGNTIGVVLSGTGSDGTLGLRRIKEAGGLTIVQDPEEAEYDGMPRAAIADGMVDLVRPVEQMPDHILRFATARPRIRVPDHEPEGVEEDDRVLQKIFAQVRARTGHDFTRYKRSTILRRIQRRMQLQQIETLTDYLERLRGSRDEVKQLFDDLLITVTEFFRDEQVFEHLRDQVIPGLFADKEGQDRVRVWSVGCSTGEEAYSLAMLLVEEADWHEESPQLQVFATDLHEPSLQRAREGLYPESIASDVSAKRLERFFAQENGSYRVRQSLREMVVFAPHNLLKDPPFSHLDLIVCRNVLIYLQRDLQEDVVALFHYALEPNGMLVLGTSESIAPSDLFICEHSAMGVHRRRNIPSREPKLPVFPFTPAQRGSNHGEENHAPAAPTVSYGELHAQMVEQYAPPSILLSHEHEVVHYSAHAGKYLRNPGGEPTQNVFKLILEPLRIELRSALHLAAEKGEVVRSRPIDLPVEGETRRIVLASGRRTTRR
jgi:two-component system CheB/CheR fusion protein